MSLRVKIGKIVVVVDMWSFTYTANCSEGNNGDRLIIDR